MANPLAPLIAALRVRILNMVTRAVVGQIDDAKKLQALQLALLSGETREGIERFQQYGITSHPHPGAEALAVFLGGNREHGIAVSVDDRRYRLKGLAQGEVALYDDLGNVVHLKRDQVLVTGIAKVKVEAPEVELAALTGAGTVKVDAATSITLTAPQINLVGNIAGGPSGGAEIEVTATNAKIASAAHAVDVGAATVDVT